jgi:glucokinase
MSEAGADGAGIGRIGVASPGWVQNGVVRYARTFPRIRDFDLAGALRASSGKEVFVGNDAGLRRPRRISVRRPPGGAGRGHADAWDRHRLRRDAGRQALRAGPTGPAGEAGHMTIRKTGVPCGCGRRGCFEKYASPRRWCGGRKAWSGAAAPRFSPACAAAT